VWEQRGPQHAADPGADGSGREVMVGMVHAGRGTNGSAAVDWWIDGRGGRGRGWDLGSVATASAAGGPRPVHGPKAPTYPTSSTARITVSPKEAAVVWFPACRARTPAGEGCLLRR